MKQAEKILNAFKENDNILTPRDMLLMGIAQYNARIKELRDQGYEIENQRVGTVNRVVHTRFVLKGKHAFRKPKLSIHEFMEERKEQSTLQLT